MARALRERMTVAVAGLAAALSCVLTVQAAVIQLPIDTQNSHISATVTEPLSRMRDQPQTTGTFEVINGEIDGDPDHLASTGHVRLEIDATSYNSGSDTRDRHVIHSALETFKYSGITFESTRIEDVKVVAAGAIGSATIVGNLNLHGITRELKVPANLSMSPDGILDASGEITFDYTDFGIKPPSLLFISAGKEVTISFQIRAERPGSPSPTPSP